MERKEVEEALEGIKAKIQEAEGKDPGNPLLSSLLAQNEILILLVLGLKETIETEASLLNEGGQGSLRMILEGLWGSINTLEQTIREKRFQ